MTHDRGDIGCDVQTGWVSANSLTSRSKGSRHSRPVLSSSWQPGGNDIVDEGMIMRALELSVSPDVGLVREIVAKGAEGRGLDMNEVAALLQCKDRALLDDIYVAAHDVKQAIYGKRVVLFAPLYYSSVCVNNCLYCGFRKDATLPRRVLSLEQIAHEVGVLQAQGHRRLLVIAGETPGKKAFDYLLKVIETVYETKTAGEIRRVNVEMAPMSVDEFSRLAQARIGTYVVFQETYHRETYRRMHPSGPKADYDWRVEVMDRAMEGGIDDVGLGVLFGLYDYKFDVLAMLQHAHHLETRCGVGPHTVSVPRMEPTAEAPLSLNPPAPVSDEDLCKIVAVLRLAVPYTGIILSTREPAALRDKLLDLGVSQMSAGSSTEPGGYGEQGHSMSQFPVSDPRGLDEVVRSIAEHGYVPSFCTGCYRKGRTGADFMDLAKPGLIKMHCLPNALMTYQEFLLDYASEETREAGMRVIAHQLETEVPEQRRGKLREALAQIVAGKRDIYF